MAIDQVHDLQEVYRKLLHSMSRPGTISSLHEVQTDNRIACYDATLLSAMTLLDAEVTFHILSETNLDLNEKISGITLARPAAIEQADFVFVQHGVKESSIMQAMEKCKNGTLLNPEASATWIIVSPPLSNSSELTLTGPGIKHTAQLETGFSAEFWKTRNKRTLEYPLGVDLIFTDEQANIVCIPRTTSVVLSGVN